MAKVKQKKSVQELLQEAIIPNNQAPFPIPDNWCWTKLGCFSNIIAGGTPSRSNANFWGKGIPWVKISDMTSMYISSTEEEITEAGLENSSAKILKKGTLLFSIFATIGSISILDIRACTNQAIVGIILPTCICKEFIYYSFLLLRDTIIAKGKGVAQKNINQTILKEFHLPIAPFEEQKRIVDKIESLFSKLDEAKELIQKSLDEFEDRKAAILHKAFNGELTINYSINDKNKTWKRCVLNDVADYKKGPFGSSITKAMFVEKGENTYKVYEQGNAIRKTTNYGKYYISEMKFQELKTFEVKGGDIIVSCAGTIGETYMLPVNCEPGIINQALMRVRLYNNIVPKYFTYYFGEILKTDVNLNAKGIAIKNIPRFSVLKSLPIPLPSIEEQQEIVRILDSFFEKEDKSKELLDMIDQIEEMKKSILSRAFRGELGTHSDDDEPAIELLKKII